MKHVPGLFWGLGERNGRTGHPRVYLKHDRYRHLSYRMGAHDNPPESAPFRRSPRLTNYPTNLRDGVTF